MQEQGKPVPVSVSWRDLLPSIWEYYQAHPAGGWLHVVLDDGNLGDRFIQHAKEGASRKLDIAALNIAQDLLKLTMTQRKKLYAHYDWYCFRAAPPEDLLAKRGAMARMGIEQ